MKLYALVAVAAITLAGMGYIVQPHTHGTDGMVSSGPQHSGGTNSAGCHAGSQPYHCH